MKYKNTAGYYKDLISSILFLISCIFLYNIKDLNKIRDVIVIILFISFFVDMSYSIKPIFHFTPIGNNIATYIYLLGLSTCIIIVIINKDKFKIM